MSVKYENLCALPIREELTLAVGWVELLDMPLCKKVSL